MFSPGSGVVQKQTLGEVGSWMSFDHWWQVVWEIFIPKITKKIIKNC